MIAERLVAIVLGGLFIYAGYLKAIDPRQFLIDVQSYRLLPYPLIVATVWFLPYLEIASGIALIVKRLYDGALTIIGFLMVVFTAALLSAWARGLDISCGCFGKSLETGLYGQWLVRDVLLLAAVAFLAALRAVPLPPQRATDMPSQGIPSDT